MSYIEIKNVLKEFGGYDGIELIKALDNISVDFQEGKITTILGPSGSGKSTLLNVITGLDSINSGEIIVDGVNVHKLNDKQLTKYRKDKVGFIFQSYNLISTLTVKENVELGAVISDNPLDIEQAIQDVEMTEHINKFPHQLSGGQQQRVAIARALVKNPAVMFCDEPTGALDEKTGKQILKLLQELNKNENTTIVMITHNGGIADMSNEVVKMRNGKIEERYENKKPIAAEKVIWS